jgi:hypothetical protein
MEKTAVEKAIEWRLEKLAFGDLANTLIGGGIGAAGGYAAGHFTGSTDETPEARAARARKYAMFGGAAGAGVGYFSGAGQKDGLFQGVKDNYNAASGAVKLTNDVMGAHPLVVAGKLGGKAIKSTLGWYNNK